MRKTRRMAAAAVVACSALLAACAANGANPGGGKASRLVIEAFNPFSGADASYGVLEISGCAPAVRLINQAGGVVGHQLSCGTTDTRGDPADAVLAANQMISSTSNLVGVLGPSSDEDSATLPIIDRAHIPMFENAGDLAYQNGTFPYYWRTLPADRIEGFALAVWAHRRGFKTAGALFGNDIAAQGNVPGLVAGLKKFGIRLLVNEQLAADQTTYQTELERLLAANPQVIFTETDARSAGILFRQVKQLGGLRPTITTPATQGPDYLHALTGAIGTADYAKYFQSVGPYAATSGPAWAIFNRSLLASGNQVKDPAQYSNQSYSMVAYDDVNLMALAMLAARSTTPSVFNNYITKVTAPRPGALIVNSFAAGKAALSAGKQIQYVGPTGPIVFDSSHNSPGEFAAFVPTTYQTIAVIPTADIVAAQQ